MSQRPLLDGEDVSDSRLPPADASVGELGRLRPVVAAPAERGGLVPIIGSAVLLGGLAFIFMTSQRHAAQKPISSMQESTAQILPPPPPPQDVVQAEAAAHTALVTAPLPQITMQLPIAASPSPMATALASTAKASDPAAPSVPALVVDLGEGIAPTVAAALSSQKAAPDAPPSASRNGVVAPGANRTEVSGLNADEQFAERVGAEEPDHSRATIIRNTRETIPQGAMIPGVLETALNSDLPGFARAVVSRDVRGFDGRMVLVPRGSRVIGQYKSAATQGQSRAFIIWTRIIRPDGVTIQIASSGTDSLGRAGLEGAVDRHFFERFGGAVLLSIIDVGIESLARTPSTQVVIGSTTQTGVGASAIAPAAIPPTIKVPQGSPIRIFVARDLDFSTVGAAK